ncbi:MAG: tetratricopeptide repeat protein [Candidatus Babeliales bacterium]|nr:tetratricopeptide repeat protein [Candidatus Babeliales bacterium]
MMTKRGLLNMMLLAACATSLIAQTAQEVFLQANQLYDEKQFESACAAYESVEPKDCSILYNIGNCYYKLGDYPQAIAHWHQAEKQAQDSLLSYIRSNIAVSQDVAGISKSQRNSAAVFHLMGDISLIWFQLLFLFLLFALFFFIKNNNHGKKYRMFIRILLLIATVSSGIMLVIKYQSLKQRRGIVMKSNVSILAGPDEQYHVLASLSAASCVEVIQERASWCKVRNNNITGWVVKDSLTVV